MFLNDLLDLTITMQARSFFNHRRVQKSNQEVPQDFCERTPPGPQYFHASGSKQTSAKLSATYPDVFLGHCEWSVRRKLAHLGEIVAMQL